MNLRIGLVAASLLGALAASPAASAMPIAPAPATPQVSDVEQVRMVCDAWGRCFWRPNYYGYYGAPPPYYGRRYAPLWWAALLRTTLSPLVSLKGPSGPLRFCEIMDVAVAVGPDLVPPARGSISSTSPPASR
jgi:hypothetical protein